MQRWAARFAYDGRRYAGWARQPDQRTIEGTIEVGLVRCGLVRTTKFARLSVASRTDRGVSARENLLALDADLPGPKLLRALNGVAPDIVFTHATPVDPTFQPWRALWRQYRYFEPAHDRHLGLWREAARLFRGDVHVASFGRGPLRGGSSIRSVDWVRVRATEGLFVLDVRAPRFVWGMVRKLVSALREVEAGRLSLVGLGEAVRGERRLTLPLAEPEGLILWTVRLPLRWRYRATGLTPSQERFGTRREDDLVVGRAVSRALRPNAYGATSRAVPRERRT